DQSASGVEQVRVSQLARGGGRRIPTQLSGAKAARGGNFGSVLHRGPQDLELLLATDERGEGIHRLQTPCVWTWGVLAPAALNSTGTIEPSAVPRTRGDTVPLLSRDGTSRASRQLPRAVASSRAGTPARGRASPP